MKINTKLLVNILVPIGITFIIIAIMSSSIKRQNASDRKNEIALSLLSRMTELNQRTYYYLLYNEEQSKREWFSLHDSLSALVRDARFGDAEQDKILEKIRQNLTEIRGIFARRVDSDEGRPFNAATAASREKRDRLSAQILVRARDVSADAFRLYNISRSERIENSARVNAYILFLLSVSILVTAGTLIPINRNISQSISRLTEGAGIIGVGNLDHRIGLKTSDEIGRLSAAFDRMAANLKSITVSRDDLAREIAERMRVEEALRKSEAILKQAGQMARLGAWGIEFTNSSEPNENPLTWSDEAYRIFGYEPGAVDVTSDFFFDHVHPEDRARVAAAVSEAIDKKIPYSIEHRIVRRDGSERIVFEHAELVFENGGSPVRMIGAVQDITERKQIEQALKQNERFLNTVIENAPACVKLVAADGTLQMMNRAGLAIIGAKTFDQIHGKSIYPLVASGHRPAFIELTKNVFEGTPGSLEFEAVSLKGKRLWLNTHAVPFFDNAGEITSLLGITVDITDRKRAEEELRESEERFRALYEQAAIGIELLDLDGRWVRGNGMLGQMLGYSEEELREFSFTRLTHPDDLQNELPLLGRLLDRSIPSYSIEKRYIHKNGNAVWVRVTSSMARTSKPYRISIIEDITERKRAENSLMDSYNLLKTIIDSMNDAISLIDVRNFRILRVNSAFLKDYGYSGEAEVAGKHCYEVTHARTEVCQAPDDICPLVESVRLGEHFSADHIHYGRQGEKKYVEVSTSPIKDENGNVVQVVHVSRDITDRKHAEEELRSLLAELERSNKELEQFAYVASHDLQEPLRMVASYMQLLDKKYTGQLDDKGRRYMHFAVDGAKRMQKLIEGLLAFSRVPRGAQFSQIDANKSYFQALANLSIAIRESRALVTTDPLPEVSGDDIQLSQVFQNLIGNGIKFRRPDTPPRVHVSAKRRGNEWIFSVRDNGIGINLRYANRIFLIFQRLHSREEYPGTGIGLALCKRIIERHHGRIWLESEPGKGSTFFFTIPDTKKETQGAKPQRVAASQKLMSEG